MQDDSLIPPMNLDDPAGVSLLEGLDAELDEEVSPHFGDVDLQTDKRRKRQDLRIEGPLTPPMFSESPMKKIKSVSFPEMLHEYVNPRCKMLDKHGSRYHPKASSQNA